MTKVIRAVVDTNVFVSFLLRPEPDRLPFVVVNDALQGRYKLLLPDELIPELLEAIQTKSYLRERISLEAAEQLAVLLTAIAEPIHEFPSTVPIIVRDLDDSFLLAAATAGDADYLVTGDRGLLALRDHLQRPRVVTAAEFVAIVEQARQDGL
jgi:uncharacterized protein